ncbi:MAG: glycerophosphodiester phosphodiesterase [Firmicutes bacterium]|nr:glycerophosphodiester phosphodiesterase [Bacillota bacterium]
MEIWAHRGASGLAPENTMAAFVKAYELGADGIELDIHRTADGVLVVMHDEQVSRTTTGRGYLHSGTYAWVQSLDAGVRYHPSFAGERVPSLVDVLTFIKSTRMKLNVEIKNNQIEYPGIERDLVNLLQEHGMIERTIVSSFNHACLHRVKLANRSVATAVLCTEFRPVHPGYAKQIGAAGLHPNIKSVNPALIQGAKAQQIAVRPYTVDNVQVIRSLNAWGADGVITNRPDLARTAIS